MKKKIYFGMMIFAFLALLAGFPYFINGIHERGIGGVNYGSVVFPLFIGAAAFLRYRKIK